jgi:hypothetical protein
MLPVAILVAGCATPVVKSTLFQPPDPTIITMLSWKPSAKPWHFALVAGSRKLSALSFDEATRFVLQRPPTAVGIAALERHLASHAHQRHAIYWKDYPPSGFRYPPRHTTDEILRFAQAHDVHLQELPVLIER